EPRLEKGTNSQFILNVGQQGYCFSKEAPCWLDTEEFQKQIEVAQVSEKAGRWPEALEIYQQAIQLYRGDYLAEDLYEEWALALREHWRELYLNALGRLAECHARMGQYERAIEQCAKVIEIKPASESAYRQQMLYHSLIGESSVALQTYQICIAVLKEQLRVEPSPETRELYEQILQGTVSKDGYPPPAGPARHNLPSSVTSFIGREREMVQIKQLLDMTRLLTLTGAGGSGKTRLALQVAAGLLKEYTDGVWLVELASLSDPSLVAQAVATAFGVREAPGRSLLERLSDYLHPKQLLLVLDNCEHLVEACAKVAEALLHACPDLQILATSREALGIAGETTWSVPPLAEPDSAQPLPTLKILKQYEAIGLFLERALSGQSQFAFTEQNARAVVQVCQRLDGLPLAIELAAARVKVLSVEEIAARLDDRFRLFVSGSRTALPHQQTLQATMDWSFQLLSEVERILLRRLSVFAGGWILEAAEAVCAGEGIEAREVLDLLAHLVDKSLVIGEQRDGKTRYRLLETVRQYAQEKLEESKESESLQSLHLTYFLQLTKQAEPELTGANQKQWLECFETELDNLRAALRWTWHAEPGAGLQLASALGQFWDVRGYWAEGRKVLGQAWERRADTQKEWHVKLLNWEGVLALRQGAYEESKRFCAESRALSQKIGDKQGFATSLHRLGVVALNQADYAGARNFLQESLTLRRELGDKHGIATSLHFLGLVALFNQADYAGARNFLQESLTLRRRGTQLPSGEPDPTARAWR
ncbi:tetratricopeptide repeat protein, partial [Candidatus Acetothermia bacterium]|nr:tetratricopeptide repeat protein [Candidatus Acetothermia bacterium]